MTQKGLKREIKKNLSVLSPTKTYFGPEHYGRIGLEKGCCYVELLGPNFENLIHRKAMMAHLCIPESDSIQMQ